MKNARSERLGGLFVGGVFASVLVARSSDKRKCGRTRQQIYTVSGKVHGLQIEIMSQLYQALRKVLPELTTCACRCEYTCRCSFGVALRL